MMRKAFSSSVFICTNRHVLLVHHRRFDLYLPVGGEVEANETPIEAAIREVREETGIELALTDFPVSVDAMPGEPPGFIGYEEHYAGAKGWHMNFVFMASLAVQPEVKLCDEHWGYIWHPIQEPLVTEKTTDNVQYVLTLLKWGR